MNPVGSQPVRRAALGLALSLILATLAPCGLGAAQSWFSKSRSPKRPAELLSAGRKSVRSPTVFDVTISLYNDPSGDNDPSIEKGSEQQTAYEKIVRSWADGVCEASGGSHKLGTVRLFRRGAFASADVVWNEREHPRASPSGFGVPGGHIVFGDVFPDGQGPGQDLKLLDDPATSGSTLAHQWEVYVDGKESHGADGLSELLDGSCRSELEIEWMDGDDLELELVIDRSRSMEGVPLEAAKAAAKTVVDAVPADRTVLGVASFDDQVRQDVPMTSIFGSVQRTSFKQTIGGISSGGESAVFDAASQALTVLQDYREVSKTRANRAVFLLTDGLDNSSGESKSSVTEEYRAAGVPLITFGYGDFAPDGVLRKLADDTGGLFFSSAKNFSEIQSAFLSALSSVSSMVTLKSFSASIPARSQGELTSYLADHTLKSQVLLASYEGPYYAVLLGTLCQSVDGTSSCLEQNELYGATGARSFSAYNNSDAPVVVSGTVYAIPLIGRTYDLVAASASGSTVTYPEPIVLTATVSQGVRITGVNVVAIITHPKGAVETVALHDDGRDGDAVAGDGIYSLVLGYDADGTYGITVRADNAAGTASFARQGYVSALDVNGHEPPPAPQVLVSEKFQREARIQVAVSGLAASGDDDHANVPTGTPLPADNTKIAGRIDFRRRSRLFPDPWDSERQAPRRARDGTGSRPVPDPLALSPGWDAHPL